MVLDFRVPPFFFYHLGLTQGLLRFDRASSVSMQNGRTNVEELGALGIRVNNGRR
jgi:hypothetical protein